MGIPVKQVSPADFIPLPTGSSLRHEFIGRYERLDVFSFDFYAVALSKLHRGNEKDFTDVTAMIHLNLIHLPTLEKQFDEILPQLEARSLRASPELFARKFAHLKALVTGKSSS